MLRRQLRVPARYRQRIRAYAQSSVAASLKQTGAPIDVHPEVEDALARNRPVVSLETALVTHGLPYPASLEVPLALQEAVRSTGAIPATIGLIGGRIKIGMEHYELDRLATQSENPSKISRRDIAAAVATKSDGGTTCSATLVFSALAGIKVFATGGLGGVHRGAETSFDISADLQELSRCPVGLVSSGVKSILDIRRTLEYLETGVPTVTYGATRQFPAFFTQDSGCQVPWNTNDPAVAANMIYAQSELGMKNGIIFAVPIPEKYQAAGERIQEFVNQAVRESEENGIARSGNNATPWLLGRILELSQGKSLESNIALLKNNAIVGGEIAVQYAKLLASKSGPQDTFVPHVSSTRTVPFSKDTPKRPTLVNKNPVKITVVGSAALDITARANLDVNPALAPHSTLPGTVSLSLGGVARNIAEAASRVSTTAYPGVGSLLVAPVGEDLFGHILVEEISRVGMRNDGLIVVPRRTAVCNMVLDSVGALVGGVGDMDITEELTPDLILPQITRHAPEFIAFDGNLGANTMKALVQSRQDTNTKFLYVLISPATRKCILMPGWSEPTSVVKSTRILPTISAWLKKTKPTAPLISHFTPNLLELLQVYEEARTEEYDLMSESWWWENVSKLSLGSSFRMDVERLARKNVSDQDESKGNLSFLTEQGLAQMAVHLLPFFQHIWIKCGARGAIVAMQISAKDGPTSGFARERTDLKQRIVIAHGLSGDILVLKHFPPLVVESLVNVTGAGDTFVGALLTGIAHDSSRLYDPEGLEGLVNTAQRAACLTLESHDAVSPLVSSLVRV